MKHSSYRGMFLVIITLTFAESYAQVTTPRTPSPGALASQTVGISIITVKYSRPSVKNRKVWGELVPYGWAVQGTVLSAPWRAGANENTMITLSHSAIIEGTVVPAGTYGLFFVLNQDNSGEVILSKDYRSWGSFSYNQSQDQLRARIQIRDNTYHTELLTYDFVNLTQNSTELVLNWEKKQFPVKIEFAVDEIVVANAKEELKGPIGFIGAGWTSAANYCLTNNFDLEQGLKWIEQTSAIAPTFNALRIKSGLLEKMGKKAEAEKTMAEALTNAREDELNIQAYTYMAQGNMDKAIKLFLMTTEHFPKSANAWDSLGEGYATLGDRANAIKCFKKSLSLNPAENVKVNSEKFLKQFEVK